MPLHKGVPVHRMGALATCLIALVWSPVIALDMEQLRPMLTSEWLGKKEGASTEIRDMFHPHQFSTAFKRGAVLGSSMLTAAVDDAPLTPSPYTVVPPFTITTSKGDLEVAPSEDAAYLLALHHSDNFTDTLWFKSALEKAFGDLPPKSHLIFAAKSEDGQLDVVELEKRCSVVEGFDAVSDRVHFMAEPVAVECTEAQFPHCPLNEDVEDGLGTMLQAFASWGSFESSCAATWGEADAVQRQALDCIEANGWLPTVRELSGEEGELSGELAVWGSDACSDDEPKMDVAGKIAVIARGRCSFFQKVEKAASKGARAVVVASPGESELSQMGCSAPDACSEAALKLPAVMVREASLAHLEAEAMRGVPVSLSLRTQLRTERLIGLDHAGRLREVGQLSLDGGRGMEAAVREAQGYAHEAKMAAATSGGDGKMVLEMTSRWGEDAGREEGEEGEGVAVAARFTGAAPVRGEVEFPEGEAMWEYDKMEVYLLLECPKLMDKSCGAWDYPVSLRLCKHAGEEGAGEDCALEVARWVTAYGRKGEWLTDATALLPFVRHGGKRQLVLQQPAWSKQEYLATVKLVLSSSEDAYTPLHTTVLFSGGAFDAGYNSRHKPVEVAVPAGAERVEVEATVSGHGWGKDKLDCAEFCVSQHRFRARAAVRVEGELFVANEVGERTHELAGAGSEGGCAAQVPGGVTPNQYGTWEYGRAGWCPGGAVTVWKGDVTSHLHGGMRGVLSYEGLVDGAPYHPEPCHGEECASDGFPAEIRMQSLLVVYGKKPGAAEEAAAEEGVPDGGDGGEGGEGGGLHPNGRPGGSAHTMKGKQGQMQPIVALEVSARERGREFGGASAVVWVGGFVAGLVAAVAGLVWTRSRPSGYRELRG